MLDVIDKYDLDLVSRVTADTPYPSNEVYQALLNKYFEEGADYTKSVNAPLGSNLSVISTSALRKIRHFFPDTRYSEYLGYYFANNPEYFTVTDIRLPKDFERPYRLTLDYQEDLDLFNIIQTHLDENILDADLKNIFKFLDANPTIASINSSMEVKYESDKSLVNELKQFTTIQRSK
jgi:spore coat polysaccharide biosynthesis protein SpsF (cytidylyltransferase family)